MLNGHSRSSQARKDKRRTRDQAYNYVDRVRLGQSSLQAGKHFHQQPRGSGWRQKSISNLDLSTNRHSSTHYIEDERQLRPSRSLDYKHSSSSHKDEGLDIAEFYWRIDPDRDYDKLPHNYVDESGYHSTNLYNQPFDIGNESCSLRRSRSLAVIREETFSDLQISTANSHRRSQLIPRARLVNRGFFKERFTGTKQPAYYHHHHHLHHHHQPTTTLDRAAVVPSEPPPADAAPPPPPSPAVDEPAAATAALTRESDEYYENLKRLDAHQQSIWQNEKSDLESLNSEYFRNSHHQTDATGEKQRLYQSRHHKSTAAHRKYAAQLGDESCPELSQSSVFPETTTTSNSDDQSDSLTNSEQEYDIERVEEILSKVYDEKFEVISLTDEQNQRRAEISDEQGALIAYDSVYLSSEESSEGTIVEDKQESASLLHISIEDICDPPQRREEPEHKDPPDGQLYSQVLRVPAASPPIVCDTKPKILAVVEKKRLKRFSDYAVLPCQKRQGVLEHLYISTHGSHLHQLVDNKYYSLPDVNIGKSLKVSERIDAKLRSSYDLKGGSQPKEDPPRAKSSERAAIYESIKHFGRAHKKARQREQDSADVRASNRSESGEDAEQPKEAPSIQVETFTKELAPHDDSPGQTPTPSESGQFRIIVTDAQNNVIEEDSIDGHTASLTLHAESPTDRREEVADDGSKSEKKCTLTRTPSKPKRSVGSNPVRTPSDVYKSKDRRVYNTYRARPAKVKPNDSLRSVGKMSRPQVIQVVDSKRGSADKKHPVADKAVEHEFLQKVDAIRCYWSKLSQDDTQNESPSRKQETPTESAAVKKDFIIGQETKSLAATRPPPLTDEEFQSLLPSIEIVELDGDKQATIVKANPDEPVPEFDHIRYKVMKPNLFRSNILNRSKKEAQFDGLIQYLQEYSFQELLTNNNVVIVEPVRTKVERPSKAATTQSQRPAGGQNCKITGGASMPLPTTATSNPDISTNNHSGDGQNKLSKRHFFYQPVRVNRELLEEELPTPDTVRNVRKFFEENILPNRPGGGKCAGPSPPLSPEVPNGATDGRRAQRSRYRYLTIDTSYGNGQVGGGVVGNGTSNGNGVSLRKWDSVSLSSGISSGDLSSPCDCTSGDGAGAGSSHEQQKDHDVDDCDDDNDNGHGGKQHQLQQHEQQRQQQDVEIRGGMHVRDFIRRHNACGSQDSHGLCGDYEDDGEPEDDVDEDDLADDELCESYYVSEDVLEKIRECGSTVTYYGGRVMMHSPPATGATLRIPRSKIEFLTCNGCQPNECPHKDQLHDSDYTGIKFKLIKSNSCSSRLELIGTQRPSGHESHHPSTIGEDDRTDNDDEEYDDGEPLVRRLVHRLETTGKINTYTGPRIIESQCIEKTTRPTSLVVTRQKFEQPPSNQRHSEGFTINNQMVGKGESIPESLAYVQLLKQVTVNNHISVPVEPASESPCFTSSAMDIRLAADKSPSADGKLANGKVRRNRNVDLAFTMKPANGTIKKSGDANSIETVKANTTPESGEQNRKDSQKAVSIMEHLPKEGAAASINGKPPTTDSLTVDSALVRHYVTNDKRLFTKPKFDDIEFEEFEVYDPTKDAAAKAEQLIDDLADDLATRAASASSLDELKSNSDECYDSLDDKI